MVDAQCATDLRLSALLDYIKDGEAALKGAISGAAFCTDTAPSYRLDWTL